MITDVFCKIIKKEMKADIVMESKRWIAIKDINPQAPVHILIVPKKHYEFLEDVKDKALLGELLQAVDKVAHKMKIAKKGYRVIINQRENGGQLVPHLHIHLLGGKKLGPKIIK